MNQGNFGTRQTLRSTAGKSPIRHGDLGGWDKLRKQRPASTPFPGVRGQLQKDQILKLARDKELFQKSLELEKLIIEEEGGEFDDDSQKLSDDDE
ncbi:unnamed protein product [Allacma fusca]|uniref:Uncharacterized protein n=1 Tax=Allacma fusca TaxID=39272 RepID=A0A8J2JKH5_9HEXA|nr:unnamed protein product [Allacma fusca]